MKNIWMKIILLLCIIIIISFYHNHFIKKYDIIENMAKMNDELNTIQIDKIYCINLEDAVDRYNSIKIFDDETDIGITHFPAIDTRTFSKSSKYYNLLTPTAIDKLKKIDTNGGRERHEDLTSGAIGCYLSHYNVWKDAIKNNYKYVLILEDDAKLYKGFYKKILNIIQNTPKDWDIILFGLYGIGTKINSELNIYKVDMFVNLHCYLIRVESIKKIMDQLIPIDIQIDWAISKMIPNINIYGIHIISQNNKEFVSQIQIPLVDNYYIFS